MVVARRDGNDVGETRDLHGRQLADVGADAELAVGVVSPSPDRAVVPEGQAEAVAAGNCGHVGKP
jgi:hypothetical protein